MILDNTGVNTCAARVADGCGMRSHACYAENMIYVGCAGWRLPKEMQPAFPGEGTHLERYGARLPACEINSSFYRSQRRQLYAKWAREAPSVRFAVKVPRWITHNARLRHAEGLDEFLEAAGPNGRDLVHLQ